MAESVAESVHAGCIVLGEGGVLIRGEPGSGKSTLARNLVSDGLARNLFARMVSDDRTRLDPFHGRIVARPVDAIAGQIEVRGVGIVPISYESGVVLRLVIDLFDQNPPRFPEDDDTSVKICGVALPRISARKGVFLTDLVLRRLSDFNARS